jgi:hypothetical protein
MSLQLERSYIFHWAIFLEQHFLPQKVQSKAILLYDFGVIFIEINVLSRSDPK